MSTADPSADRQAAEGQADERSPAEAEGGAPRPEPTVSQLAAALAEAAERLRQEDGPALQQRADEVRDQVASLGRTIQDAPGQPEAEVRRATAAQIEQLVQTLAAAGAAAGRALAKQGAQVKQAVGAVDLSAVTEGLRRIAEVIASGAPDGEARVKELIAQLQGAVGPSIGKLFTTDAERQKREEEERRAAIKRDVQASLDEIFRGKKKT